MGASMNRARLHWMKSLLSSRVFWFFILGFFVFESTWIALSAAYPMAFDEDFHLGIIKIYAGQWLPFFDHIPAGSQVYGAITQDPSYLYQYLMSFPYRFFSLFTHDQNSLIILLRLINIALMAISIVLFRKVLRKASLGRATTNLIVALFVLIPVVPLLAAQINYDNLLMVCVAWLFLLAETVAIDIKSGTVPLGKIIGIITLGLLGSLVKYAFLPIVAATGVFVLWYLWSYYEHDLGTIWRKLAGAWRVYAIPKKALLITVVIVSVGLFAQRYIANTVMYHTPIPDCGKVLDDGSCQQYGPWNRDKQLAASKADDSGSPAIYMAEWLYGMWYRLFFVINGNVQPSVYQNFAPLPVIGLGAAVLLIYGLVAYVMTFKRVMRGNGIFAYFLVVSLIYIVMLWAQNYGSFLHTGRPVAVNGRYLLPILPLVATLLAVGVSTLLKKRPAARNGLAALMLLIFLEGGGLVSFIVRSNDAWYWDSQPVRSVNDTARMIVSPLVIGSQTTLPIVDP